MDTHVNITFLVVVDMFAKARREFILIWEMNDTYFLVILHIGTNLIPESNFAFVFFLAIVGLDAMQGCLR